MLKLKAWSLLRDRIRLWLLPRPRPRPHQCPRQRWQGMLAFASAPWLKALDLLPPTREFTLRFFLPESSTLSKYIPEIECFLLSPFHSDTITAHEKKRHYYECLEEYVLHVHEQIKLAGLQPIPFERVPTYQGLHSRSIRVRMCSCHSCQ